MKDLIKPFLLFTFLFFQISSLHQNNSVINKNPNNIFNSENISKNEVETNRILEEKEEELTGLSIERYKQFIEKLKTNSFEKIIFLTGAGVSTAAGIPDFRSSEDGIFKQLLKKYQYRISSPKDIFDIFFFEENPRFFYEFCKDFNPDNYSPTLFHYFMGYINSKNKLDYVFTQNIDGLDLKCGIDENKIIFAHGNFETAQCSNCTKKFDKKVLREHINNEKILYCDECKKPVKPGITFYGEVLSHEFFEKAEKIEEADLIIMCGTSLLVTPFNQLPGKASQTATRLVINKEPIKKNWRVRSFGFNDEESNDIFFKGECDNAVKKIVKDAGWEKDFYDFVEKTKKQEESKIKN